MSHNFIPMGGGYRIALGFFIMSLLFAVLAPVIVQYGLFFDGILYGAFARNLSESVGSFWNVQSWLGAPPFRDHPPLGFWIQSHAFTLLGDLPLVEGVFGFGCLLATSLLLFLVHKALLEKPFRLPSIPGELKQTPKASPWVVLIFFSVPVVNWSFRNNMLENQVVVFTTFASWCFLKVFSQPSPLRAVGSYFLGSLATALAFGIKGPPALFPLCVPVFAAWFLIGRGGSWRPLWLAAFIPSGFLALFSLFLYTVPGARAFFSDYFYGQLVQSALGNRESSGSRLTLVWRFFENVGVPVALLTLVSFLSKRPPRWGRSLWSPHFFLPLGIGLSGFLPFLAITKQMGWYLIPALPFFSICLFEIWRPVFEKIDKILEKHTGVLIGLGTGVLVLGLGLSFSQYGKIYKNKEFFTSFLPVLNLLPPHKTYGLCHPPDATQWQLVNAIHRYARSGVAPLPAHPVPIWVVSGNTPPCFARDACTLLNSSLSFYKIYSCGEDVSPQPQLNRTAP